MKAIPSAHAVNETRNSGGKMNLIQAEVPGQFVDIVMMSRVQVTNRSRPVPIGVLFCLCGLPLEVWEEEGII